jgi:hypothetical protein
MNDSSLWMVAVALACGLVGAWVGGLLVARQVRPRRAALLESVARAPAHFDEVDGLASVLDARFDAQQRAWQEAIERLPQTVQRALQVELDFLAQQQAQRDAAQVQREQARDEALRLLVVSVKGRALQPEARSAASVSMPAPASRSVAMSPPAISARPPELLLTPLPQPEPVYDEPAPERVLSDEEIDALPPELPTVDRPRRRVLPTPKKPVLRNL